MDMSESCWICGKESELGVREIVTFRDSDRVPEVSRVATCFECRAELIDLHDAKERALARVTPGRIRIKALDIAGVLLTLAGGMFISAWAGWVGPWFHWVGIALVAASPLAAFAMWKRATSVEANRDAEWKKSPDHARLEEKEKKLRERWESVRAELEAKGHLTEVERDERTLLTLEPHDLVEPATWKPHEPPTYVERTGDRSERRTLER
jgi:hypothetical protein